MAWTPDAGLVDPFGGQDDLAAGVLRCVGDPDTRFAEDALRVLRAVRVCRPAGFCTRRAHRRGRPALPGQRAAGIAGADFYRVGQTAGRPRCGGGCWLIAVKFWAARCPKCSPASAAPSPGRWHCYDVWRHTAVAVAAADTASLAAAGDAHGPQVLRWATLLHDLAKPLCRTETPDGAAHFPGHNQRGAQMAPADFCSVCARRAGFGTACRRWCPCTMRRCLPAGLKPCRRCTGAGLSSFGVCAG